MAFPDNWTRVPITGTFIDNSGDLLTGKATFTPSLRTLTDPTADPPLSISADPIPALITNGVLQNASNVQLQLPACDDATIPQQGWVYSVTISFDGSHANYSYNLFVPEAKASSGIDLSTVVPAPPSTGFTQIISEGSADLSGYQLRSEKGQANGYAGLGDDGKVTSSQLPDSSGGASFPAGGAAGAALVKRTSDDDDVTWGPVVTPTVLATTLESYATTGDLSAYGSATAVTTNANNITDLQGRVGVLESGAPGGGTGVVLLDSFTGSTDDDRLTAAMAYAAAQTYHPTIQLLPKAYSFTAARTLYDGFRLQGPPGYSNAEKSAVNQACKVDVNVSNGIWLNSTSGTYTWDVYIAQLCFTGHSSVQFMGATNSGLYCPLLRDLSFSSFKSVLGSQATKLLLSAAVFDGYWDLDNSYNGAIHIGGSDNTLWPSGMLLDSGTAFNSGSAGQYHLWCDYLEKSSIGPIYVTCEANWGGIRVSGPAYNSGGSNLGGPLVFAGGMKVEGRNAGAPCNGSVIRVEGGIVVLRDAALSYAMASPSSNGHSPVDAGAVHVTSGRVQIDSNFYDHATGIAETVPFVYAAGGQVRISNQMVGSKGGAWTGLPGVKASGGTIVNDTTVTVL